MRKCVFEFLFNSVLTHCYDYKLRVNYFLTLLLNQRNASNPLSLEVSPCTPQLLLDAIMQKGLLVVY
jgi:hypothetical protein